MDFAVEAAVLGRSRFLSLPKSPVLIKLNPYRRTPERFRPRTPPLSLRIVKNRIRPANFSSPRDFDVFDGWVVSDGGEVDRSSMEDSNLRVFKVLASGFVLAAMVFGFFLLGCQRVLGTQGVLDAGFRICERGGVLFRGAWPKTLQVMHVLKEQGLVLAALLGLSAFFSMAETSITTLWPWKVRLLSRSIITIVSSNFLCVVVMMQIFFFWAVIAFYVKIS